MAFKDITGQDRAIGFFRNVVSSNRLAHAYLFLGPEGVGKTLLAKNLAKFVNCENPSGDCCDNCASCRKTDNNNHPDVHWIEPERTKNISIEEVRLLRKEVSLKAYEGRYKVFIILEADSMTMEAANSLLKVLEEPPEASLIILISTNISGILPTITSRCQLIKFLPRDYEKPDAPIIEERNRILEGAGRLGTPAVDIFNIRDKRKLSAQMRYLLNWFRDILVLKTGLPESYIMNNDRTEDIKSQAEALAFEKLMQILTSIDKAHRLIEQNVNPKIALEVMLGGIAKCRK